MTILFLIALLLLISFSYRKDYTIDSTKTKLISVDRFADTIEKDAKRAIYISGQRTLVAILDYSTTKGKIPDDVSFDKIFADAFINGSLNYSLNYDPKTSMLNDSTLGIWANNTVLRANMSKLNLTFINLENTEVSINQSDPWAIDMNVSLAFILRDNSMNAEWHRNVTVEGKIPIFGLEDPLYPRNLAKDKKNIVHKSNYYPFVDENCSGENLTEHFNTPLDQVGSYYIQSDDAPNYLSRLRGKIDAMNVGTGIESLINIQRLGQGVEPYSLVDHSYFSHIPSDPSELVAIDAPPAPTWIVMTLDEANNVYHIPSNCYF